MFSLGETLRNCAHSELNCVVIVRASLRVDSATTISFQRLSRTNSLARYRCWWRREVSTPRTGQRSHYGIFGAVLTADDTR
jgi:hypothetical protein